MECRLVLNNRSTVDIPNDVLCGQLQQQLKYYKFRRDILKSFVRRVSDQIVVQRLKIPEGCNFTEEINSKALNCDMTDYDMEIPELNPDIGLHLVNFLNGTDASKFLEVVNNCSQFVSIGTASDRLFVEIMKKSDGRARILLPAKIYGNYLQDCEILDDKLVPFENHNPSVIQPAQRLQHVFYQRKNNEFSPISNAFVNNIDDFRYNLATRFFSLQWLETIDFSKFAIVGSCVLNSLCRSPFGDTKKQDINLIYPARSCLDFEMAVLNVITKLKKMQPMHLKHEIMVEKISGSLHYYISLPCGVKLNFYYTSAEKSKDPLSHVLHNFDMDICQVAFIEPKISNINSGNSIEPSTQDKVIPTVSTPTMKRGVSAVPPPMTFASTATMVVSNNTSSSPIPEISYEELLEMGLIFEKQQQQH
ncbi:unnamed protein product [Rotaria magnacalcarata]|uniref:Uncharacterized protein n=2 Tax=Rotaria magnacalcarata TaxID=392030 RepID=A0A8S2PJ59_9BILA|nr:unnamed protein product [Rotaria magnacalcarata]